MVPNPTSCPYAQDRKWLDAATVALTNYSNDSSGADAAAQTYRLMQNAHQTHALSIRDLILASASCRGQAEISACSIADSASVINGAILIMLVCSRLTQTGKSMQLLATVEESVENLRNMTESNAADLIGELQTHVSNLVGLLQVQRHHSGCIDRSDHVSLDPRMLAFECTMSVVLRKRQVEIVANFVSRVVSGNSGVQQMLMGAGKSSVVSPLLGLLLANGQQLVTVVVPQPLLEQAVSMISQALASTFGRRVTRLFFSRSCLGQNLDLARQNAAQLAATLQTARSQGSVVVTTGAAIKAIMLKVIELTEQANKATEDLWLDRLAVSTKLQGALDVFRDGVALLDECDLLLHPLRSEMNFPVHQKKPLAMMNERADIGERLVDALFPLAYPTLDAISEQENYEAIEAVISIGKHDRALQSSPHVVITDRDFYRPCMLTAFANWLMPPLMRKVNHCDALLKPIKVSSVQTWSTKHRGTDHNSGCAVDEDPDSFYCSDESNGSHKCSWGITLTRTHSLGAVDITYRQHSPFLGRSGLSMVPAETIVMLSVASQVDAASITDEEESQDYWTVAACAGEFQKTRIYLHGQQARHIRLQMSGAARWFAIKQVALYEQLPDRRQEISTAEVQAYLTDEKLPISTVANFRRAMPPKSLQLLNLSRDMLQSYLPHCMSKINRVAYGLLPPWLDNPMESSSRRYMAVPFTGKDTPSAAAEFSHPDILILLTLLAYRYEGLRPQVLILCSVMMPPVLRLFCALSNLGRAQSCCHVEKSS
eukprot:SAG31_NODE_357_length_17115_cov_64.211801_5_plen_770_part_00